MPRAARIAAAALLAVTVTASASVPTVWTLSNNASRVLYVECVGGPVDGGPTPSFAVMVPLRGMYRHTWGQRVSDPQRGLLGNRWTCAAGRTQHPVSEPRARTLVFVAADGEDLRLSVREDRRGALVERTP